MIDNIVAVVIIIVGIAFFVYFGLVWAKSEIDDERTDEYKESDKNRKGE